MSISSLNSNFLAQSATLNQSINSPPSLQSLSSALSSGDLSGAKSIFSALSTTASGNSVSNSTNNPSSAATNTLMGQLGSALQSANVGHAQQITSALQTLTSNAAIANPLLSDSNSQSSTSTGFNDSLFNALSLTGVGSASATSLAGVTSPAASGMVSPQQVIAQNMDTFLNNLLTTLKAQNPSAGNSTSSSATSSASLKQNPYASTSTSTNQLSGGLQALIQQIAKSPNALNELNTSGSNNAVNGNVSTDLSTVPGSKLNSQSEQVSQLQKSYDDLLSSQGSNGGASGLINFLQNFESNMKSMQSSGGFLNVNA